MHGNELHRMTDQALAEITRYTNGEPFAEEVRAADLTRSA